jgi:hypothetical protein
MLPNTYHKNDAMVKLMGNTSIAGTEEPYINLSKRNGYHVFGWRISVQN